MANRQRRIYWDACTYIDYLKGDHPLAEQMAWLLKDWSKRELVMVTSALTIAEVLWVKCREEDRSKIEQAKRKELRALFEPPHDRGELVLVELTRNVALTAREMVWKHNIKPKDAIHVASALRGRSDLMHTNDEGLQSFTGKVGGEPILLITAPKWEKQMELELGEEDD